VPDEPEDTNDVVPASKRGLTPRLVIDRYELHGEIASGGMGTVHIGRLVGDVGFARPVAIKRLHKHLAHEREFVKMFIDEARLASRVRHPNVVQTLDVVRAEDEIFLVMEYVHGATLSTLVGAAQVTKRPIPMRIVSTIVSGMLQGLHAAHEAKDEQGVPLGIVHRDVSPHNVIVCADGVARLLDFGVLQARGRLANRSETGVLKGKLGYIPPEQFRNAPVTRLADVYAASVVLWEMLACRRLYAGDNEAHVVEQILVGLASPPSKYQPDVPDELDELVLRGLDPDPSRRFPTARAMAMALERIVTPAPAMEVGFFVERMASDVLARRAAIVASIESAAGPPGELSQQNLPSVQPPDGTPPPKPHGDELSSISVARRRDEPRKRRGALLLFASLAIVSMLGVFVWFVSTRNKQEVRAPAAAIAPSSIASPSSSVTSVPAPSETIETLVDPTPNTVASGNVPTTKKPPAGVPKASSSAVPTTSAPTEDCAVPYWWDALGVRHYKRHCLPKSP